MVHLFLQSLELLSLLKFRVEMLPETLNLRTSSLA